jgi:N-acetylmuramoyl-L-alanine amidase
MAKIAIDAGHYLYEPGRHCFKPWDPNQTKEWVLNDRVADALEVYLRSAGHTTKRMDDTTGEVLTNIYQRADMANDWGADYYISIHHNGGIKGGTGGGTVVFVCPGAGSTTVKAQKAIYNHAIARCNLKGNRSNPMPQTAFVVLTYTHMPAALIECGFMDAPADIPYIIDPEWSKKMALAIAEGICEVFGGTVKADAVASKPVINEEPKKSLEEVAKEVLAGKWGNGTDRKKKLAAAGYDYAAVQAKVNELKGVKPEVTSKPEVDKDENVKIANDYAAGKSDGIKGTYKVIAPSGLNLRHGAGTSKALMVTIPNGTKVTCYGYYTKVGNDLWYYVSFKLNGMTYQGFCICSWLARV